MLQLKSIVCENTKEGLMDALMEISEGDADWSGINGPEYTRDEALGDGYESSAEYYAEKYGGMKSKDAVRAYMMTWLGEDSYYTDYAFEIEEVGDKLFLSVAYTTD